MVLYFSGTGNSRYVARIVANEMKDELVSINGLMKKEFQGALTSVRPYVIVCPIYAWKIPRVVEHFIENISFDGEKEVYFLVTCESQVGEAPHYIKQLCERRGLHLLGVKAFFMPSNYVIMSKIISEKEQECRLEKLIPEIKRAAEIMDHKEFMPPMKCSLMDKLESRVINPLFYQYYVGAKGFHVNEQCIGCGRCENLCPLNNIRLQYGKPIWGDTCTHCMACIGGCPSQAIDYKNKTQGKRKYYVR